MLADLPGDNLILLQITNEQSENAFAIFCVKNYFSTGLLPIGYYIRLQQGCLQPTRVLLLEKKNSNTIVIDKVFTQPIDLFK